MNLGFWHGKTVFVTGHTGFKGGWLALWLHELGAEVTGISLEPEDPCGFFGPAGVAALIDSHILALLDRPRPAAVVAAADPEIVCRLAAQALVLPAIEQ